MSADSHMLNKLKVNNMVHTSEVIPTHPIIDMVEFAVSMNLGISIRPVRNHKNRKVLGDFVVELTAPYAEDRVTFWDGYGNTVIDAFIEAKRRYREEKNGK